MFKYFFTSLLLLNCVAFGNPHELLLKEANEAFEQANVNAMQNTDKAKEQYKEAQIKYAYLIDQGVNTSALHNNLANTYFFSGDIGRAILHYQRALRLAPNSSDIIHNLKFARSRINDELQESTSAKVMKVLFFWHQWSYKTRLFIFAIFHFALWACLACALFRKSTRLKAAILLCAFLSLLSGISIVVHLSGMDNPVDGVITESEVTSRQGNGHIYEAAFNSPLHSGSEFKLLAKRPHWYHIELLNGEQCWINENSAELIVQEE